MLRRIIIITLSIAAVAMVVFTLRRGPRVVATSAQVPWSKKDQSAMNSLLHVEEELSFFRRRKGDNRDAAALVQRGDEQITLEGMHSFLVVKRFDQRVWAIAEAQFPNANFDVLVSEDGGATFTRHTAPRPEPGAMIIGAEIREREITLTFSTAPEKELSESWCWPWWRYAAMRKLPHFLRPSTGATFIEIRSRDAGHVWQRPWR